MISLDLRLQVLWVRHPDGRDIRASPATELITAARPGWRVIGADTQVIHEAMKAQENAARDGAL